jgi:hypothetical protein
MWYFLVETFRQELLQYRDPMDYALARESIQDGDLIGVRDVHGLLGRATTFFTRKPYTHTGVAVWLDGRLFMGDLNSGRNHLTALSCIGQFDVCDPPPGVERSFIRRALFDWLATPISYGAIAFLVIGLRCWLGLRTFIHWRQVVVCSGGSVTIFEMAVDLMQAAGLNVPAAWEDHNRMLSPGELVEELGPPKLRVGY